MRGDRIWESKSRLMATSVPEAALMIIFLSALNFHVIGPPAAKGSWTPWGSRLRPPPKIYFLRRQKTSRQLSILGSASPDSDQRTLAKSLGAQFTRASSDKLITIWQETRVSDRILRISMPDMHHICARKTFRVETDIMAQYA